MKNFVCRTVEMKDTMLYILWTSNCLLKTSSIPFCTLAVFFFLIFFCFCKRWTFLLWRSTLNSAHFSAELVCTFLDMYIEHVKCVHFSCVPVWYRVHYSCVRVRWWNPLKLVFQLFWINDLLIYIKKRIIISLLPSHTDNNVCY